MKVEKYREAKVITNLTSFWSRPVTISDRKILFEDGRTISTQSIQQVWFDTDTRWDFPEPRQILKWPFGAASKKRKKQPKHAPKSRFAATAVYAESQKYYKRAISKTDRKTS